MQQRDPKDLDDALNELVRLGEHVITNQLRITEEQDAKVRHLLTLAGGILVVAVAVSGLVAGRPIGPFLGVLDVGIYGFLVPITCSFVTSFWASILFASAYNGSKRNPYRVEAGWNPKSLLQAVKERRTLGEIRESTLHGIENWFQSNQAIIAQSLKTRRVGTTLLLVSGASLAIALIYSLGAILP